MALFPNGDLALNYEVELSPGVRRVFFRKCTADMTTLLQAPTVPFGKWRLYPNPTTTGMLYVALPDDKPRYARLYDTTGQLVEMRILASSNALFDWSHLPNGWCWLEVENLGGRTVLFIQSVKRIKK